MTTKGKHRAPTQTHEVPPPHEPPPPHVDVLGVLEHLLDAMAHMARQLGSPPDALQALAEARALLGKES